MTPRPPRFKPYLAVYAGLIALTFLTVGAARLDLGAWNVWAALGIAAFKALLVMLYFMHLRESAPADRVFATAGFACLALLVLAAVNDFIIRMN